MGTPSSPSLKIGANDPCHCGSGKKYKRCCRKIDQARRASRPSQASVESLIALEGEAFFAQATQYFQQAGQDSAQAEPWFALGVYGRENHHERLAEQAFSQAIQMAQTPTDWWNVAVYYEQEKRQLQKAIDILEDKISPDKVNTQEYWERKAGMHAALQQWDKACQAFQEAILLTPNPRLYWDLLFCLYQQGDRTSYINTCEQASKALQSPRWHVVQANAHFEWGQHPHALQLYQAHFAPTLEKTTVGSFPEERALLVGLRYFSELIPEAQEQHRELYRLLCKRSYKDEELQRQRLDWGVSLFDWPQVESASKRWLKQNRHSKEAQQLHLLAKWLQGEHPGPKSLQTQLQELRSLFPTPFWYELLQKCLQSNLPRITEELLTHLLSLYQPTTHESDPLESIQFFLWEYQGKFTQLIEALSPLLQSEGTFGQDLEKQPFLPLLGKAYLHTGQFHEAIEVLTPLWESKSHPESVKAGISLANAYRLQGQHQTALSLLKEVQQYDAEALPLTFWFYRGILYAQTHDFEKAADDYLVLLESYREPWLVESTLHYLLSAQRYQDAEGLLEKEVGYQPTSSKLWYALALVRWMQGRAKEALEAFQELSKDWLQENDNFFMAYKMKAICHFAMSEWMETLDCCESLSTHIEEHPGESSLTSENKEIEILRRKAVQGLLEEQGKLSSQKSKAWRDNLEAQLRAQIQSEWQNQRLNELAELAHQKALMQAEKHFEHSTPPENQAAQTLQEELDALRQAFMKTWQTASQEEQEQLLLEHSEALKKALQQHTPARAHHKLEDLWGKGLWLRLPKHARELLQGGEQLLSMLSPQQDHAPVVLQWSRAAEDVINQLLVDNITTYSTKCFGKGFLKELPKVGGRFLKEKGNRLSLGSIPYLFSERWQLHDSVQKKSRTVFNHDVTEAQKGLWKQVRESWEKAGIAKEKIDFVFLDLPEQCQSWAVQRNRAAHAAHPFTREEAQALYNELLKTKENLFTRLLQLPRLDGSVG